MERGIAVATRQKMAGANIFFICHPTLLQGLGTAGHCSSIRHHRFAKKPKYFRRQDKSSPNPFTVSLSWFCMEHHGFVSWPLCCRWSLPLLLCLPMLHRSCKPLVLELLFALYQGCCWRHSNPNVNTEPYPIRELPTPSVKLQFQSHLSPPPLSSCIITLKSTITKNDIKKPVIAPPGAPPVGMWVEERYCGLTTWMIAVFLRFPCTYVCPSDRRTVWISGGVKVINRFGRWSPDMWT